MGKASQEFGVRAQGPDEVGSADQRHRQVWKPQAMAGKYRAKDGQGKPETTGPTSPRLRFRAARASVGVTPPKANNRTG
jgi:hypothetical protein